MKTQQRALRSQQEAGRDESLVDYAEKMQALMKYKTLREIWKQVMAEDDALTREKLGEWGLSTRGSARHVKERRFRWEARNISSKYDVPWDTK